MSRNTAITNVGMLIRIALVSELLAGRKSWTTSVTMPMAIATPTVAGMLRSRAATKAANPAAIRAVMPSGVRPLAGAASTPASPASAVLTIHTPTDIADGFTPDSDVIAGVSTIARTRSPILVSRMMTVPMMTTPRTQAKAMTWSSEATAPKIRYTRTGSGARPGAVLMVWFPKHSSATAGSATDTPMVETILISEDARRRCRNSSR